MRDVIQGFVVTLVLLAIVPVAVSAGEVPTCCNCQDCPAGVSACIELPSGTTEGAAEFVTEVCQPLGCTAATAGCLDVACANFLLCTEEDQCADGVDNDADGLTDCADSICSSDPACGASVPALGWLGLGALLAGLTGLGLLRLKQR